MHALSQHYSMNSTLGGKGHMKCKVSLIFTLTVSTVYHLPTLFANGASQHFLKLVNPHSCSTKWFRKVWLYNSFQIYFCLNVIKAYKLDILEGSFVNSAATHSLSLSFTLIICTHTDSVTKIPKTKVPKLTMFNRERISLSIVGLHYQTPC